MGQSMAGAANRTRLRFGEGSAVAVDLVDSDADDRVTVNRLRSDPGVRVLDLAPSMIRELQSLVPAPTCNELAEPLHWMFYPWRRTLVSVLGPVSFSRLRLDRNRNKITLRRTGAVRSAEDRDRRAQRRPRYRPHARDGGSVR